MVFIKQRCNVISEKPLHDFINKLHHLQVRIKERKFAA